MQLDELLETEIIVMQNRSTSFAKLAIAFALTYQLLAILAIFFKTRLSCLLAHHQ